jgi:protein phosphatase
LADDELYLLRFKDDSDTDSGVWKKVPVTGKKPGARYGHSVVYFKPYIVVFGGNTGNEPTNDVWGLKIETSPFSWTKIEYEGRCPQARVYHTSSIWSTAKKTEMVLIFGGRGGNGASLNDLWGLRRHNNGDWDWVIFYPLKNSYPRPIGQAASHPTRGTSTPPYVSITSSW